MEARDHHACIIDLLQVNLNIRQLAQSYNKILWSREKLLQYGLKDTWSCCCMLFSKSTTFPSSAWWGELVLVADANKEGL